jgi:hypothetical protein
MLFALLMALKREAVTWLNPDCFHFVGRRIRENLVATPWALWAFKIRR